MSTTADEVRSAITRVRTAVGLSHKAIIDLLNRNGYELLVDESAVRKFEKSGKGLGSVKHQVLHEFFYADPRGRALAGFDTGPSRQFNTDYPIDNHSLEGTYLAFHASSTLRNEFFIRVVTVSTEQDGGLTYQDRIRQNRGKWGAEGSADQEHRINGAVLSINGSILLVPSSSMGTDSYQYISIDDHSLSGEKCQLLFGRIVSVARPGSNNSRVIALFRPFTNPYPNRLVREHSGRFKWEALPREMQSYFKEAKDAVPDPIQEDPLYAVDREFVRSG